MEQPPRSRMPGYRWITLLAGLSLVLLYAALVVALGFAGILPWPKLPAALQPAPMPTPTPEAASTPHILVHPPSSTTMIRSDDFSKGLDGWDLYYAASKMQTIDSQLVLESNEPEHVGLALDQDFLAPGKKYYVQADFAADMPLRQSYGLVFGASDEAGSFYLLEATPDLGTCSLLRHTHGGWDTLAGNIRASLRRYPKTNTLSVYFDDGRMELYVNGVLLSTYVDSDPFRYTGIGALVMDAGYRVYVDNFFGYSEK